MKTDWREILQSTPMRLTLRLVGLFLCISLLTFLLTWWRANEALLDATQTTLDQELWELSASGEPDGIASAVTAMGNQMGADQFLVQFDGPMGRVGNYVMPLPGQGLRQDELDNDVPTHDGPYILKTQEVAGGRLTVGQPDAAFEELREVFSEVLAFTLLPTVLLVLTGGLLIARRSTTRLGAIETTLARLTAGDLTARLPELPGPRDDLTRVGRGIDRLASAQQSSVEALRQISADIAHDLKTPIQRLAVLLSEARRDLSGPQAAKALDRAEAEVEGIVTTFHALLRIAQIEGGSPRSRFGPVSLEDLVRAMADLYEPAASESGHQLTLQLNNPAIVKGDRALLGQAIANLIENALRHTPSGSHVTLAVDGRTLCVSDTGPGIPADERRPVLRRLYRLDRSRSTPGSGLGLSLVDAVVKLHDGKLDLTDNAPGLHVSIML